MLRNSRRVYQQSNLPAYIIGNGPSRKSTLQLTSLENIITYGCNALYREYSPHFLFTNDSVMMFEILDAGYKGACIFADYEPLPIESIDAILEQAEVGKISRIWGKKENYCKEFVLIPTTEGANIVYLSPELAHIEWAYKFYRWGQSTGLLSLQRALENGHVDIELHGFDGLKGDGHKNIYDGTKCYTYDPRKKDGVRNPNDYVPLAADNWNKIFDELCTEYMGAVVKLY